MTETVGKKVKLTANDHDGYTPVQKTKTITVSDGQEDVQLDFKKDVAQPPEETE